MIDETTGLVLEGDDLDKVHEGWDKCGKCDMKFVTETFAPTYL